MLLKKSLALLIGLAIAFTFCSTASAQVRVRGYTRKNGTYVAPHYRSNPDGNFYNNWSTKGNVNPFTGRPGTKVTPPANYRGSSGASDSSYSSYSSGSNYSIPEDSRELERQRRLKMMQQRRDDEKAAHLRTWASLPAKDWNDEEFAKSKFQVAHNLYRIGKVDRAKYWLEKVLHDYPTTDTASRARVTLARL